MAAPLIAPSADDALLIEFYRRHWLEMGVGPAETRADWRELALAFLTEARQAGGFAGFVVRRDGIALGSACARPMPAAYPAFRDVDAVRVGYVWGLYVEPAERGQGLGRRLVEACLAHLAAQGCGRALLHAGPRSLPLYARLGFSETGEMALKL